MARTNEEYSNEVGGYPSEDRTVYSIGTITAGSITSYQGTSPWVISGTVAALQGTSPWISTNASGSNNIGYVGLYGGTVAIDQNIRLSTNNTTSSNLAYSGSFTGVGEESYKFTTIQTFFFSDRRCNLYVDQGTSTASYELTDSWTVQENTADSRAVYSVAPYFRVRVVNDSVASLATSTLTLMTAMTPNMAVLPRSLDEHGHLVTSVEHITDEYGFGVENTPNDEMRTITPYRLVGATFVGNTLDSNYWTGTATNSGSVTSGNAQATLQTGATANSTTSLTSVRKGRYIGGSSQRYRGVVRFPDTGAYNNLRKWGCYDGTDGAYFKMTGTLFGVATLRTGTETNVYSGSLNGNSIYHFMDTNVHTYEIYYNNSKVYFAVGGELIHTVNASTNTWTDTLHLPCKIENNNVSGGTGDVSVYVRNSVIHRLGTPHSTPLSNYQSSMTNFKLLKNGPGNIHQLFISDITRDSQVVLVDGITGASSTIWSSGTMSAQTVPLSLDMKFLPFYTGLGLSVQNATSLVTIIYE